METTVIWVVMTLIPFMGKLTGNVKPQPGHIVFFDIFKEFGYGWINHLFLNIDLKFLGGE
jgi:hypothetical protein